MDPRRPSLVRRAVAWLALAAVLGGGLGLGQGPVHKAWSEGGVSYLSAESAFRRALRSKDPGERARAFEHLRGVLDARVVDAVQAGMKDVVKAMEAVRKAQVEAEKRYEAIIDAQHQAQALFETSAQSGRDLDRYNKTERKLSKERDEVIQALKDLENDHGRERSLENSAVLVLGDLLEALPDGPYAEAHARLLALWRASRVAADVERWVAVMAAVRFLFGDVLSVSTRSLWLILTFGGIVLLTVFAFYKEFMTLSFDPILAVTLRLPVGMLNNLLLALIAVTVAVSLQTVGVALMVAMLVTPAATAYLLTNRLFTMMLLAALIASLSGVIGLYLSFYLNVASGAAIVLTATVFFILAFGWRKARGGNAIIRG